MNQTLIAVLGLFGGVVLSLVDGRRAVGVAALAAGVGLAPAAAAVGGAAAALVPVGAAAAAALAGVTARAAGRRLWSGPGLDPRVPVVAPDDALFGPRSLRALGAAIALPAASWVSLNVEVGTATGAGGALFAASYVWLTATVRLLRARSVEDMAVGAVGVALAAAAGWILEAPPGSLPEAMALAGLAPVSAATAGWLVGRHRRPRPGTAGGA